MMLGTPASNSMAVPIERRNQTGHNSVKNSAIPKLKGTAIKSAISEVTNVPKMAIAAPYTSLTGSHSTIVMKRQPNSRNTGMALMTSDTIIPAKTIRTVRANKNVSP